MCCSVQKGKCSRQLLRWFDFENVKALRSLPIETDRNASDNAKKENFVTVSKAPSPRCREFLEKNGGPSGITRWPSTKKIQTPSVAAVCSVRKVPVHGVSRPENWQSDKLKQLRYLKMLELMHGVHC